MKKILIIIILLLPFSLFAENLKELNDSMKYYISANEMKSALPFAKRAGEELKKKKINQKEADSAISRIINIYINLNMPDEALAFNRMDSARIAKSPKKKQKENRVNMFTFGLIYAMKNQFNDAEKNFKNILALPNITSDTLFWGRTLYEQGKIYFQKRNLIESENYIRKSYELFSKVVDSTNINLLSAMKSLGVVYRTRGKLLEADTIYSRDLIIKGKIYGTNSKEYAAALNSLALLYRTIGRFTDAKALYSKSLKIESGIFNENSLNYATTLSNMAALMTQLGDLNKAEGYFTLALKTMKGLKADKTQNYLFALNNFGRLLTKMGAYEQAKQMFKEALDASIKVFGENHPHTAICNNNISDLLEEQGKYQEAYTYSAIALQITKEFQGNSPVVMLVNLARNANLLRQLGRFPESDSLFKEALSLAAANKTSTQMMITTVKNNYAKLLMDKKEFKAALDVYEECLANNDTIYDENSEYRAADYLHIGQCYGNLNQKDSADHYYYLFIKTSVNLLNGLFPYFNDVEKSNYLAAARINFEIFNSYNLNQPTGNQNLQVMYDNSLLIKGILLNSLKKLKEKILESNNEELINDYTNWQNKKDYLVKLVNIFELENNEKRQIIDSLEATVNDLEKKLQKVSTYFRDYINLKPVYWQDVQNALKEDEAAVEIVRVNNYAHNPNPFNSKYSNFCFSDDAKYAMLILKKNAPIEIVVLENGNDLENSYLQKYKAQVNKSKEKYQTKISKSRALKIEKEVSQTLEELFGLYFEKVYNRLGGIKKIYISPDGVFNQINLNTLINSKSHKHLIEEIDIQILTSTRYIAEAFSNSNREQPILKRPDKYRDSRQSAELFGDPVYWLDSNLQSGMANTIGLMRSEEFSMMPRSITEAISYSIEKNKLNLAKNNERQGILPLPGTKVEVDTISMILSKKGWNSRSHLGAEALEEVVKAVDNPSVLHMATHGIFLPDLNKSVKNTASSYNYSNDPMLRSMLLFSGAENSLNEYSENKRVLQNEDGFLTALEAMNLKLDKTDLVVLSACETGLGEIRNGEGVYGLQRAFAAAGAKSIVMSLWTVSDETTQLLMTLFYQKWLGGINRHDAFRQAQIELKNLDSNIYYWGAFVIEGD